MSWVRLDDQWSDHPKFVGVGDMGQLLWVKGLTYAARYLTDGHLTDASVDRLLSNWRTARALALKLVSAGLWERTEAGYKIHDYEHYQPLASEVKARRKLNSERMKRWRNGVTNTATNGVSAPFVSELARAHASDGHSGSGSGEAETTQTVNDNGTARAESGYDIAKRVWSEMWAAKYGQPYIFTPASGHTSEDFLLQRLGRLAKASGGGQAEGWLRRVVKAFLRDPGGRNWLSDNRHPLRAIERDLNKYAESKPLKPKQTPGEPVTETTLVVPMSVEEQGKRAAEVAIKMRAIGLGGAK